MFNELVWTRGNITWGGYRGKSGNYSYWFVLADGVFFDYRCCTLSVVKTSGRGNVYVSGNSIIIDDDIYGGPDCYNITVSWVCSS